jgi:hypothetical protein
MSLAALSVLYSPKQALCCLNMDPESTSMPNPFFRPKLPFRPKKATVEEGANRAIIQEVPFELMRMMFSDYSKGELATLQRTSKHMSRVIEPLLYERINWEFHKPAVHKPPIHLLLRTLLDRPELGEHVKEITIQEHKSIQSIWQDKDKPELESTDLERLAGRAVALTTYHSEPWLDELQRGNHEEFVALLLYHCPNVQRLVLENDFLVYWSWGPLEQSWRTWTAPSIETLWHAILNLRKLREIDVDRNGRAHIPWWSKTNRPSRLFSHPNITSIRVSYHESEVRRDDKLNSVQNLDVKTFELHNSYLSEDSIALLVARTPNVTSLSIDLKFPRNKIHPGVDVFLDCVKLRGALDGLFSSGSDHCIPFLEHLAISTRWETPDLPPIRDGGPFEQSHIHWNGFQLWYGIKASIGSLKCLSSLKSLEISPEILLGWYPANAKLLQDLIPDSVTHLCLRADFGTWSLSEWKPRKLRDLFTVWGRGPHNMKLNSVKFVFPDWFWLTSLSHDPEEVNRLEVTCMAAGLQVEIQKIFIGPKIFEKRAPVDPNYFTSSVGPFVQRAGNYFELPWYAFTYGPYGPYGPSG